MFSFFLYIDRTWNSLLSASWCFDYMRYALAAAATTHNTPRLERIQRIIPGLHSCLATLAAATHTPGFRFRFSVFAELNFTLRSPVASYRF